MTPQAALTQAAQAVEKLQGLQALTEFLGPLSGALAEIQQALACVIQDQGLADQRFDSLRYALIKTLEIQGLTTEGVFKQFEDAYQYKQLEREHKKEDKPCISE